MMITIDMVSGEIIEDSTKKDVNVCQDIRPCPFANNIEVPELSQLETTDSVANTHSPVLFDIANMDIDEFIDGM